MNYKFPLKNTISGGLLLFFLLNAPGLNAERIRLFTPDDGLSNSHINHIYQDSKGYIWIATENGLNKFNGYDFEVYSSIPNDPTSLQGNYVSHVYEDSRGYFWVSTSNGLFRYDRTKNVFSPWKPDNMNDVFRGRRATCILEDRNNNLWISFPGNGVVRLDAKTLSPVVFNRQNSGIGDNTISCMFEDRYGNLWFGTEDHGIFVYNPLNYSTKHYRYTPSDPFGLSNNKVFAICEDADGNIRIGTIGGGINVFDMQTQSFRTLKPDKSSSSENLIYSLLLDKNKTVWVGTDGAGIFKYDAHGNKTHYWEEASSVCDLRSAKVHALIQDKQGNIWAALYQKGVLFISASGNFFQNIGFNPFDASKSIGLHCVISVIEDRKGNVWAGTDGDGLYRIQPSGQIDHFTSENTPGFPSNVITALFEDRDHSIWIGTYVTGFFRYNPQTGKFDSRYRKTDAENGLSYDHVTGFTRDDDGNLWIATNGGGISVLNPNTNQFKHYLHYGDNAKDQISGNWVYDILIDSDKEIWAATSDGLNRLNKKKDIFEAYPLNSDNRTISNLMYTLHEDYKGNIWIGSYYGLHCLNKKTGKSTLLTTLDGLPDNMIAGIEEDLTHDLWISTGRGLCRYHPETGACLNFFAEDGIQSNEFRRGSRFKGKNDKMYFGGINGITTFYPSQISHENQLLELVFTDFLVYNEPVRVGQSDILEKSLDETTSIRLKHNQHSFTFSFAALEFSMPQRVNYYVQMENFDTRWRQIKSPNRSVTYTNLNPGVYVFKVKAAIDEKYVLQKDMQVIILPPWWWSTPAKIAYIAMVILLLYAIYAYFSYRLKQRRILMEKEQQKQLSESKLQFFTDISHEIRTPLTLIIGPLEKMMAMQIDDSMRASFHIMYQNAIRILRLINQLMDLRALDQGKLKLKIEPVDILEFVRNIMDSFAELANARQIDFKLQTKDEFLSVFIDKDCLDKIIFNILSNAFKFTPQGGSVTVDVQTERADRLVISVSDSGIGISKEQQEYIFDRFYRVRDGKHNTKTGTGIGLHFAKMMAELHHGSLRVESEPGKGSRFSIRIPLQSTVYAPDEFGAGNEEAPVTIKHLQTRIEKLIQLRETLKQKYTGELEVAEDSVKVMTSDEKLLFRFNEQMKEHLTNPDLSVDSISKDLGISRVHLNRRFKAITGESPGNYIRNYRLKHAARLLVTKNMTIAEIAYAVGFSSQAYFSNIFKGHYGMSPTEYAETQRKE